MTDNEIIKALECCANGSASSNFILTYQGQPLKLLLDNALDLINRQKAEIEELESEIDRQYEQAEADILGNLPHGGASCHWCIDKHKAYAIKEFAERLKKISDISGDILGWRDVITNEMDINNLVKEMVGEG